MIDTVVFDWGGTLSLWAVVDMEDMWRLAAEHIAAQTGAPAALLVERLCTTEARMWGRCAADPDAPSFRLADILQEASQDVGADVAEAVLEEAATRHLDSWTGHVQHDADAHDVLRELRSKGLRIGLLSNTHWPAHWHEHFLERDGLGGLIDVRVYSCDEPRMKPHAEIFHKTLDRLGSTPDRAVMVGDRMLDDVKGAQGAGMRAVWKRTRHSRDWPGVTPDATIASLRELPELISGWS